MVKEFQPKKLFIWNFALVAVFQHQGLGQRTLREFITHMQQQSGMEIFTPTYTLNNLVAKLLHEQVGFEEKDMIQDGNFAEVNMIYKR